LFVSLIPNFTRIRLFSRQRTKESQPQETLHVSMQAKIFQTSNRQILPHYTSTFLRTCNHSHFPNFLIKLTILPPRRFCASNTHKLSSHPESPQNKIINGTLNMPFRSSHTQSRLLESSPPEPSINLCTWLEMEFARLRVGHEEGNRGRQRVRWLERDMDRVMRKWMLRYLECLVVVGVVGLVWWSWLG
jgi:hypothetical protein